MAEVKLVSMNLKSIKSLSLRKSHTCVVSLVMIIMILIVCNVHVRQIPLKTLIVITWSLAIERL